MSLGVSVAGNIIIKKRTRIIITDFHDNITKKGLVWLDDVRNPFFAEKKPVEGPVS